MNEDVQCVDLRRMVILNIIERVKQKAEIIKVFLLSYYQFHFHLCCLN